jgi:hypothetical protein
MNSEQLYECKNILVKDKKSVIMINILPIQYEGKVQVSDINNGNID